MKAIAVIAGVLSTIASVKAVGNVPDGIYSSDEYATVDPESAREYCDTAVSCAGMTYRPNEDVEKEYDWTVYFHSFLPPLLNNKTNDWVTERSSKSFVFHPGKLVNNETLDLNIDPSTLSLHDAQELCKNNTGCVAFSYPTKAMKIDGFEDIIFSSSVQSLDTEEEEGWQTHVINDESKAEIANASIFKYEEELELKPYNTCCDASSPPKNIPTIQDVQRMDTLPRISCDISKEEFQQKYEFTRTPVVLVGCQKDWSANNKWTVEKLTERFVKDDTTTWNTKMNGEGFDDLTWMEVTERLGQDKSVYIFDDLNAPTKITMKSDYSTPPQFADTDMYPEGFAPSYGERNWFCLGERYSGAPPHVDPVSTDAWNSLVSGHKWWVIYSHNVEESMVECDTSCSKEDINDVDWFASIGMHAARTSFGNATPMHVLQKAGETLYVPFPLIHSVLNMDTTIAITSNHGSPGNLQKVWETALRKGSVDQWVEMYNDIFTDEQRATVTEGEFWPPDKFAGVVIDDAGDSHYGGVNGMDDALEDYEFVYEDEDGNKFQYEQDEDGDEL